MVSVGVLASGLGVMVGCKRVAARYLLLRRESSLRPIGSGMTPENPRRALTGPS